MDIIGKKLVVVGGAGLIGSHTVDRLLQEDVGEIVIYDNFVRGRTENLAGALRDARVRIHEVGGDITQTDILATALAGADGVFHLAALWLLQCHEYPRSAFDVNVRGTFNVMEACVQSRVARLVYSSSASVYGDAVEEPMTEDHPFNNRNFYGATKICGEAMLRAYHHRYGLNYVGLRYIEEMLHYDSMQIGNDKVLLPRKSELGVTDEQNNYGLNLVELQQCREFKTDSIVKYGAPVVSPGSGTGSANRERQDQK